MVAGDGGGGGGVEDPQEGTGTGTPMAGTTIRMTTATGTARLAAAARDAALVEEPIGGLAGCMLVRDRRSSGYAVVLVAAERAVRTLRR